MPNVAATLLIARHGETIDNANGLILGRRDPPLSTLGREQSERLARQAQAAGVVTIWAARRSSAFAGEEDIIVLFLSEGPFCAQAAAEVRLQRSTTPASASLRPIGKDVSEFQPESPPSPTCARSESTQARGDAVRSPDATLPGADRVRRAKRD